MSAFSGSMRLPLRASVRITKRASLRVTIRASIRVTLIVLLYGLGLGKETMLFVSRIWDLGFRASAF